MQLKYFLAASAASLSLACGLAATPAFAQETSSSVRGTVEGDGAPIAGATVTVVHEPSGTTQTVVTGADGTFSVNGLRVGGPFTVTVDADGYEAATANDLYLQAGQPFRLPVNLLMANVITVSANSLGKVIGAADGPTTFLNRDAIESVASVNRDVRDLARRDPLVTVDLANSRAIEIAGNNGRLNRFSVDGVQLSDDFGLNNGGLPTSRGPVPFDAIEQFSVKVAPFDITEGDFQGGAIDVVLRSGTNKFHGNAFYSYTDDSLTGSATKNVSANFDLSSKNYGALLAGPIIPDKLFFMAAYEKADDRQPYDSGIGPGVLNQVPLITQANIDQVTSLAQSIYNFDTLGFVATQNEQDEKYVAKIDFNATDNQRLSFTYLRNDGVYQVQQNTFLTPTYALGLESNSYRTHELINTGTVELNSTWSNVFSSTARVSFRDYNRDQDPTGGRDIAQFEVCLDPTSAGSLTSCNTARIFFGPDISRHANYLRTNNLTVDLLGRIDLGDHLVRVLGSYEAINVYNVFVQGSLGNIYFDSIADFQNRRASRFRLGGAVPSLKNEDAAAVFGTEHFSVGIQDEWQVTDTLSVTAGVRYDWFYNSPKPPLNPNFLSRYGYSNLDNINGIGVVQPRAGFQWEVLDRLIIRGGVGIFSGGTPDVYVSNLYSNTGLLTNQIDISRTATSCNPNASGLTLTAAQLTTLCNAALNNVSGRNYDPAVLNFLTSNTASLALAATDNIDPDFGLPRKIKASLQFDYRANLGPLGDDWLFGVSGLYDENLDGLLWRDIRSVQTGLTTPDGRPRYNAINNLNTTNRDLQLTNSHLGRAWFLTARFAKQWDFGLAIDGSYTRSNVKDQAGLTNSTSSSNYQNNVFVDPNIAEYGRSIYEIRDQYKFSATFKREFFRDAETRLSLFGEYRSGKPYSLTMLEFTPTGVSRAGFGTIGQLGKMLLYVPTASGDGKVSFDSAATETAFNAQVAALGLDQYRGQIVPKNSQTSSDFFKVDLHVSQDIPLPVFEGSKVQVFADVENLLNMINKDWGALSQVPGTDYTSVLVRVQCLNVPVATGTTPTTAQFTSSPQQACAQYRYSNLVAPQEVLQTRPSLYAIRVGVRVEF